MTDPLILQKPAKHLRWSFLRGQLTTAKSRELFAQKVPS